jgi:hypothetical protein
MISLEKLLNLQMGKLVYKIYILFSYFSSIPPAQRREQLELQARALQALAETLETLAKTGDRTAMNALGQKIAIAVEQLIGAARAAQASGADPNGILMDATKGVSEALKLLLGAAATAANKPNDAQARDALLRAQLAAQAALQKLAAASKGIYADEGYQQLLRELAKAVSAESQIMVATADQASARVLDPAKKQQLVAAIGSLDGSEQNFAKITDILAAVAQDPACKTTIEKAGRALDQTAGALIQSAQISGVDSNSLDSLNDSHKRLQVASLSLNL